MSDDTLDQETELDKSGCLKVENDEGEPLPYCTLATRLAVLRKSLLDSARATAIGALQELEDETIGDKFTKHHLTVLIDTLDEDAGPGGVEEVSYDDLLVTLIERLEEQVTTDAKSLLQIAQCAAHALLGEGWVVARSEKLRG